MQILPINISNNQYNKKNISHKGNYGTVYDKLGNMRYRVNTWFFRSDFDWYYFPNFINDFFKKASKVNFYNYGCSSGEESYSIALKLINNLEEKSKKFFPIIAKDIDEDNIKKAKLGSLYINDQEKDIIDIHTKAKNRKYYNFEDSEDKILRNTETDDLIQYKGYNVNFSDFIREKIEFSKGDILKDIDNVEGNNTILICRNLWPYLKENDREMLMYKIYRKFAEKNSILVLGDFDKCYPYSEKSEESVMSLLDRFNFRETSVMNVYTNRAIF